MVNEVVSERNTSKTLGILSIILGVLVPIVGFVLGVIGISIKKSDKHYSRDVILNVIGIIVSLLSWLIVFIFLMGTSMY